MTRKRIPPAVDAAEWARQERGLQAARSRAQGAAPEAHEHPRDIALPIADDAALDDYRLVATAIATAPRSAPPAGFAAAVAARTASPARAASPARPASVGIHARSDAAQTGFERRLAGGLLLLLGIAAPLAAAGAIAPAWRALRLGLGGDTLSWTAIAATCIATTWAVGQVRQLRAVPPPSPLPR